jgi:hypothetical protein
VTQRSLFVQLLAVAWGLAYGIAARLTFGDTTPPWARDWFPAMSIAFLIVVPFSLGAISVHVAARERQPSWLWCIFGPWIPCSCLVLSMAVLLLEGAICLVMIAPAFFVCASLGGLAMGAVHRYKKTAGSGTIAGVVLLPFVLSPLEHRVPAPTTFRTVRTEIAIDADAATVWKNVVEVPAIQPAEREPSFFQRIGIPRPSEATISFYGKGAVRDARFVEGIRFRETITRWEPNEALGFSIEVDPASVDPKVLDEHVQVGGPYFDVVYGEFSITPAAHGVVLHLESRHRLTTHFNAYASIWSEAVMRDLQRGICRIIQKRSERGAPAGRER